MEFVIIVINYIGKFGGENNINLKIKDEKTINIYDVSIYLGLTNHKCRNDNV